MRKTATRKTTKPTETRTRTTGKAKPTAKTRSRAARSPRPLTKRDIDRWMKWWDWEKPDSTIDPRLRTVHHGIAGLLLNHYRGESLHPDIDDLPWTTIAGLAAKAEGSGCAFSKDRIVWAGIIADWAFRCAAPAWLALLPKGVSPHYDNGLIPDQPSWWSHGLIRNMNSIVQILIDIERSAKATTAERSNLLWAVHFRLLEVMGVGNDALSFRLDRASIKEQLPRFYYVSKPTLGEADQARIEVATRVAGTMPELLERVATTRGGDALEYVRNRCQWPDLTVPAKPKGRKAA